MSDLLFSVFPNENFVDLDLYQFGWEQCTPAHSFGPAARNHYLFHYVISGTGTLMADDSKGVTQTYQIKSGQGFMLFPGQISTYVADKNLPWEYAWLEFDGLKVREMIEIAGITKDSPIYHANSKDLRQNMMEEMLYIVKNADKSPLHLIGHLYLFLDYMTRSAETMRLKQGGRLRDFYIKEALSFIEQNFQNDISVEDIAAFCGLNRSYFGKIFHDTIGKSPQEFLMSYRMQKATELLKLTQLSIGDIGNAVGYPNQLHFSRAFKNVYGVSPREWRNANRIGPPRSGAT
ncbi:AraC family transcriptional regulator [bacterium]|uniref:AraC family transcriptional regulator n=1 Tax=Lachnospiraceae TaxID=186803 RepID=UPI002A8177C8|nr:AraC family transcriptional regulator [Blautia sp.]MCI6092871.1 AraC family transcriptional regulator [bacterium]MDY4502977.1 AraC family transcriptional regulator [Bariatricus sp.]MDD7142398.1 AraC family transcriptional regulator [bacterium]MDY4115393.1 AraC family transcriptional regulator [Blautia sp.]MDY5456514.1 AraC family transcriptional regulator [Bariatricus sp.]